MKGHIFQCNPFTKIESLIEEIEANISPSVNELECKLYIKPIRMSDGSLMRQLIIEVLSDDDIEQKSLEKIRETINNFGGL